MYLFFHWGLSILHAVIITEYPGICLQYIAVNIGYNFSMVARMETRFSITECRTNVDLTQLQSSTFHIFGNKVHLLKFFYTATVDSWPMIYSENKGVLS